MDLIERYLAVVGWDLPQRQRADITAELRDLLQSQVEEKEAELGRPLKPLELEQLLVDFGHPLVVAGRYRKTQQLIGPEVFPFWWAAIRGAAVVTLGIYFVVGMVNVVGLGDEALLGRAVPDLMHSLIYFFGLITLGFVAAERFGWTAQLTHWRPKDLPPPNVRPSSRFDRVVEVGMGLVFLLWWTGVLRFRDVIPLNQPIDVQMGPVWAAWFWPILIFSAADTGVKLASLLRPGWRRATRALEAAIEVCGAAIILAVWRAGDWFVVSGADLDAGAREGITRAVDLGLNIAFPIVAVVMLVKAATLVWRLWRETDGGAGATLRTGRAPG